jgi:hypothetical protein
MMKKKRKFEIPLQLNQSVEKVTARVETLKGMLERLKEYKSGDHYLVPTCEKLTFDHQTLTLWERVKKVKRHPFIEACNRLPHFIVSNGNEGLFNGADFDEISKFIENVTIMFKPEFAAIDLEMLHNGLEECLVQLGMIEQQVVDSRIEYEPIAHLLPLFGEITNKMRSGIESAGCRTLEMIPLNADAPIDLQMTFNMSRVPTVLPFLMQSFCVGDQEAKNEPQSMKIVDDSHPFYTVVKCWTGNSGGSMVWVFGLNSLCLTVSNALASRMVPHVGSMERKFEIRSVKCFDGVVYQSRHKAIILHSKVGFFETWIIECIRSRIDFNPVCKKSNQCIPCEKFALAESVGQCLYDGQPWPTDVDVGRFTGLLACLMPVGVAVLFSHNETYFIVHGDRATQTCLKLQGIGISNMACMTFDGCGHFIFAGSEGIIYVVDSRDGHCICHH